MYTLPGRGQSKANLTLDANGIILAPIKSY